MASFGGVAFRIEDESETGPFPGWVGGNDWDGADYVTVKHLPTASGSSADIAMLMGVGAERRTHRLLFDNQDDWRAFLTLRQTVATYVGWDATVDDVLLERIEQPYRVIGPDGQQKQRCVATFRKSGA